MGKRNAVDATGVDTGQSPVERQTDRAGNAEAINALTVGIAHDLNNVLAVLMVNLDDLARAVGSNAETAPLLAEAQEAALRGAGLTRRLLELADRGPPMPVAVSVNELIGGMMDPLRRTLDGTIRLAFEADPALWPAHVDPARLEASLLALALNVREALPDGGTLMISTANGRVDPDGTYSRLAPGDYATILVAALPSEAWARRPEPFLVFEESDMFEESDGDAGPGLDVVREFVRRSNGCIAVPGEPGLGTAFRLWLPRSPMDHPPRGTPGQ